MSATQAIVAAEGRIIEAGRELSSVSYVALMAIALDIFKASNAVR